MARAASYRVCLQRTGLAGWLALCLLAALQQPTQASDSGDALQPRRIIVLCHSDRWSYVGGLGSFVREALGNKFVIVDGNVNVPRPDGPASLGFIAAPGTNIELQACLRLHPDLIKPTHAALDELGVPAAAGPIFIHPGPRHYYTKVVHGRDNLAAYLIGVCLSAQSSCEKTIFPEWFALPANTCDQTKCPYLNN